MAKQMKPFRHLLKPSTPFKWTTDLDQLFQQSKQVIINEMKEGVRLFDPSRTTCLSTDWSVDGVGFFLLQKYCHCTPITPACCHDGWKLCLVGSRFTTPAESRYAPIEGEALAVAYALHQTRYYILGCTNLIVATDHKPLLQILNDRSLTDIHNRRLLNLKEKTLSYRFTIVHIPGKKNPGPDAASRHPTTQHGSLDMADDPKQPCATSPDTSQSLRQEDSANEADDLSTIAAAITTLNAIDSQHVVTWDMVREATASDPSLCSLIQLIADGFPSDRRLVPADLQPYHKLADSLCVVDGVVLTGQRIVIPLSLRPAILQALHAAHQGVTIMCTRAHDCVYWPNLSVDITKVREGCAHCHRMAKSNPMQPPSDIPTPDYPFQMLCADYFTYNGRDYVVIVDRYSNWPMVYRSESGADGLIRRLREVFVTFGIPENLTTDGGPQFTAGKTQEFLRSWGVQHRISSVGFPHANCRAEVAVKIVKRMLVDNVSPSGSLDVDKFQRALLIYRNTIDPETQTSPALVLFGRPIRDAIPIPRGRYTPHVAWRDLAALRESALAKRHSRDHERWGEHTHRLPPLKVGDHVYLQNLRGNYPRRWERTGIVVEVRQHHQYVVRVDGSGRVTIRNRQHLRKFTPFHPKPQTLPVSSPIPQARQQGEQPLAAPARPTSPSSPAVCPDSPTTPETPHTAPRAPALLPAAQLPQFSHTTPPPLLPDDPQPDQSDPQLPPPVHTAKVSRTLARLNPHNKPGTSELAPLQPRRQRTH